VEQSLSPKGEQREASVRTQVTKVTFTKSFGKTNLYEVETNNGVEKVAAADAAAAKAMVEGADSQN
jgi:hypothetical protein